MFGVDWLLLVFFTVQGVCGYGVNLFGNLGLPFAYARREIVASLVKGLKFCPVEKNVYTKIEGEVVVFEAFFICRMLRMEIEAVNALVIDSVNIKNDVSFGRRSIISISIHSPSAKKKSFSRTKYISELAKGRAPSVFALGIPSLWKEHVEAKDYLGRLNWKMIGNTLLVKPRFPIGKGMKYAFTVILHCSQELQLDDLFLYHPVITTTEN